MENNNNYMRRIDQETDNDFKTMIQRIMILCGITLLVFGAFKFLETVPETGKIEDHYSVQFNVRTNDAATNKITIKYRFIIDTDKLDTYSREQFNQNRENYYKGIFYWHTAYTADAIRNKAMTMNYAQPNIIEDYKKMVYEEIKANMPMHVDWIELTYEIEHDPKILELFEKRKEAAQNVYDAQKKVAEAEAYAKRMILQSDKEIEKKMQVLIDQHKSEATDSAWTHRETLNNENERVCFSKPIMEKEPTCIEPGLLVLIAWVILGIVLGTSFILILNGIGIFD